MKLAALAAGLLLAAVATARADEEADKREARALLKEGIRLLEQKEKDYPGALELFRKAYAKYPSAKILLNIGSALKDMGRGADAANVYQRYLEASDADAGRVAEVQKILKALDARVGFVVVETEADAELQIGDGDWIPMRDGLRLRAEPGSFTIRARRAGTIFADATGEATVGAETSVRLIAPVATEPEAPEQVEPEGPEVAVVTPTDPEIQIDTPAPAPSPTVGVGAAVNVLVDGTGKGAAVSAGIALQVRGRVDLVAMGIVGPTLGGYAGASVRITRGRLRPTLGAGVPLFFSDGLRYGVRGAAGLEWAVASRIGVIAEVGVEHFGNAEEDVLETVVVPAVGVRGWL